MTTSAVLRSAVALAFLAGTAAVAQEPIALSLGGAARLAAERNAAPQAARQRIAQAEARVRQRRAEFLPNVSAVALDNEHTFNSASFGISFDDPATGRSLFDPNGQVLGPVKTWDLRGVVRQNIYDPGSFARLRAAKAVVTAVGTDAGIASQQAAAAAATLYVRALRADAQVGARLADSSLAAELLAIAREQVTAGTGIALDVTRAQSQLSVMHSQLIAARAERSRATLDLTRALGLPLGTPVTLTDSLFALPIAVTPPAEADAVARATRTRSDLLAIGDQTTAAERQLDAIRAEVLPALSLFADQGSTGKATQHLLSTYNWGIELSVPVFDGFRRDGRMDEQRAALRELDVRRRDLAQQAAADVRAALLDLDAAREQLAAADERFTLAEQELAQARDRFRAGVSGNADAITASLALNAARAQVVDARAALQAARVSLGRAQGTVTELP
ncbi:MAG: TolC family protein [Gemmatimonadetes bacterium]|nr:TolC family protein [Gemmatimonadota bacterium]